MSSPKAGNGAPLTKHGLIRIAPDKAQPVISVGEPWRENPSRLAMAMGTFGMAHSGNNSERNNMDTFSVVRTQMSQRAYPASGSEGQPKLEVAGILKQFVGPDAFVEAIRYREDLMGLAEKLAQLGVSFAASYGFEIQQTRTGSGVFSGTRSRLIDLSERDNATNVEDVFFGETAPEMVKRALEADRHRRNVAELEGKMGIGDDNF